MKNIVMNAKSFIFGGNAEFTIRNLQSGNEYKYKVRKAKNYDGSNKKLYFVKVKLGHGWTYAGYFCKADDKIYYSMGKKGKLDAMTPPIRGLFYAINKGDNKLPGPMEMIHHGRCACCGKKMDDDVSIERGFGPVCWKKLMEG